MIKNELTVLYSCGANDPDPILHHLKRLVIDQPLSNTVAGD
jgi:hypothetical protein